MKLVVIISFGKIVINMKWELMSASLTFSEWPIHRVSVGAFGTKVKNDWVTANYLGQFVAHLAHAELVIIVENLFMVLRSFFSVSHDSRTEISNVLFNYGLPGKKS